MSRITIPIPASSFIGVSTSASAAPTAKTVRSEPTITALTGGAANALDSLPTVTGTYPVGIWIQLLISGVPALYQLVAGTTATDSPWSVRPQDYSVGTNEKVWVKRA